MQGRSYAVTFCRCKCVSENTLQCPIHETSRNLDVAMGNRNKHAIRKIEGSRGLRSSVRKDDWFTEAFDSILSPSSCSSTIFRSLSDVHSLWSHLASRGAMNSIRVVDCAIADRHNGICLVCNCTPENRQTIRTMTRIRSCFRVERESKEREETSKRKGGWSMVVLAD